MNVRYKTIGIIHTPFKDIENMPIQSIGAEGIKGTVILKNEFTEGLKDLEGFSHIYLVYHFHESRGFKLQVTPFLNDKLHGIFATRAPKRPNPIGLSVVKLLDISENILEIENVDMLDGTPLLDIKPYIPGFDIHQTEKNGWFSERILNVRDIKSDKRFK
jgi:tRNA-Thr(GGU) m(6)t(6)A37 methyltransferase TsaA